MVLWRLTRSATWGDAQSGGRTGCSSPSLRNALPAGKPTAGDGQQSSESYSEASGEGRSLTGCPSVLVHSRPCASRGDLKDEAAGGASAPAASTAGLHHRRRGGSYG